MKIFKQKTQIDFIKSAAINLCVMLVFWGGLLRSNFNSDTITFMVSDRNILINIEDGRYIQSLFDYLYEKLGFRLTSYLSLATLGTLCFFALSMTVLQLLFLECRKKGLVQCIPFYVGTGLVFLNVLYVELLMFGECCLHFGLGYFCASVGAYCYAKKKWILSFGLMVIAACTYQYTVIYSAIILAFYFCHKADYKLSWTLVWKEVSAVFWCLFMGLLNFLSIKILGKIGIIEGFRKASGIGSVSQKLTDTFKSILSFLCDNYRILPKLWMPLLFVFLLFTLLVWQLINNNELYKLITYIILITGSVLLLLIIPWMNATLYYPPRMSFCFYLIIGLLVVAVYKQSDEMEQKILAVLSIVFLGIQLLFAHFIIGDRMISNNLDEIYAFQIYEAICDYEKDTGITVNNICVIHDIDAPDYYVNDIRFYSNQINERVIAIAPVSLLEALTGRSFNKVSMDQCIFKNCFEGKNWDMFKLSEQVVINNDTIYWCVF